MKVALIDYGAGNLTSVAKALAHAGMDVARPHRARDIAGTAAVVLPGVGHFRATAPLQGAYHLAILDHVKQGKALLGVCLGLQWLFEGSAEAPETPGLGLFPGRCFRLDGQVKVPHVGWNSLEVVGESRLLHDIEGPVAYFTHSFAAPVVPGCTATTTHGLRFASVVERDNVFAVQWHPEKSGATGLSALRNFVQAVRSC